MAQGESGHGSAADWQEHTKEGQKIICKIYHCYVWLLEGSLPRTCKAHETLGHVMQDMHELNIFCRNAMKMWCKTEVMVLPPKNLKGRNKINNKNAMSGMPKFSDCPNFRGIHIKTLQPKVARLSKSLSASTTTWSILHGICTHISATCGVNESWSGYWKIWIARTYVKPQTKCSTHVNPANLLQKPWLPT